MRAFAISATRGKEDQIERLFLTKQGLNHWPEEIRRMKHLRILDLSGNHLQQLPTWLPELLHLQHLDLSGNPLTFSSKFFPLPASLERLVLLEMNWTALPSPLFQLPRLISLNASQNQLKDLDKSIGQAAQLEELILDGNALRALPSSIQRLSRLRKLSLRQNQLKRLPASMAKCQALQIVQLDDNQLRALPAKALLQWGQLEVLSASNNRIRQLPSEIAACSMLRKLHLAKNRLRQLPLSLAQLAWLASLDLSDNKLQQCPKVIPQCKRLRQLSLAGNRMKKLGTWPATLALEELDLSRNQLADIHTLNQLQQLQQLQLQSNKLANFDPGFWDFPKLRYLNAQRNAAKLDAASLLGCPRLVRLDGLLSPSKKKALLHFLRLAREENWRREERVRFFPLFRRDKVAWQELRVETAWRGAKVKDPYFAAVFRKFLLEHSARKTPLKSGKKVGLIGELREDQRLLRERMSRLGLTLAQEGEAAVTHRVLGTQKLPAAPPSLDQPWLSEAQLVRQLDRLEGKKWTRAIKDQELEHLRTLLMHKQAVNCHLALQMLRGSGVPKVLLTDLLALLLSNRFPDLQENLRRLLLPYLPDGLTMILEKEVDKPPAQSPAKEWQKWLASREIDVERLILLMK